MVIFVVILFANIKITHETTIVNSRTSARDIWANGTIKVNLQCFVSKTSKWKK